MSKEPFDGDTWYCALSRDCSRNEITRYIEMFLQDELRGGEALLYASQNADDVSDFIDHY